MQVSDTPQRVIRVEINQLQSDVIGKLIHRNVQSVFDNDFVWLRYSSNDQETCAIEGQIPGERFDLIDDDRLVPVGSQLATVRLPKFDWRPLGEMIEWKLPSAAFAGEFPDESRIEMSLVRGGAEKPASAAIYARSDLKIWLETAAAIRLANLSYCFDGQECLVVGDPLPPVKCQYLQELSGVLLPAGMTWAPAINSAALRAAFDVPGDDWLVWLANHDWSVVPKNTMVPLRRSSFRAID